MAKQYVARSKRVGDSPDRHTTVGTDPFARKSPGDRIKYAPKPRKKSNPFDKPAFNQRNEQYT